MIVLRMKSPIAMVVDEVNVIQNQDSLAEAKPDIYFSKVKGHPVSG